MSTNTRIVNGPGFRICYDDEPGYLRAYVFDGTDSLEVSIAMWRMLASECAAVGADKLLVVEDLLSTVGMPEFLQVIDIMQALGLHSVKLAFVELREDIEGAELGEILCRERGMTGRVFSNETEARRWLLYGDESVASAGFTVGT